MRFKRFYFLLLLAVAFMLGHQLVPHCHCAESKVVSIADASHGEGFFAQVFSVNIGANHLENYTAGKVTRYSNSAVILLSLFQSYQAFHNVQDTSPVYEFSGPVPGILRRHITAFSLRPPPVV